MPVVRPSSTPLTISGMSFSVRAVVPLRPGRRRSISSAKSPGLRGIPSGTPLISTDMRGLWDSPARAILNVFPKALRITYVATGEWIRRV